MANKPIIPNVVTYSNTSAVPSNPSLTYVYSGGSTVISPPNIHVSPIPDNIQSKLDSLEDRLIAVTERLEQITEEIMYFREDHFEMQQKIDNQNAEIENFRKVIVANAEKTDKVEDAIMNMQPESGKSARWI